MGLFSRKAGSEKPKAGQGPAPMRYVILPAGTMVDVVGESHYQGALEAIADGRCEDGCNLERWAYLVAEPDNPYDRNAIAVVIDGYKVGYLGPEDAAAYAEIIAALREQYNAYAVCRASIRGGWDSGDGDRGHFAVVLTLIEDDYLRRGQDLATFDPGDPPPLE